MILDAWLTESHLVALVESRSEAMPHAVAIETESGSVWCSCDDYFFRHGPEEPTVWDGPGRWCAHILALVKAGRRRCV